MKLKSPILTKTETAETVRDVESVPTIRENALYSLAVDFYVNVQYLIRVKHLGMWVRQYKTITDYEGQVKLH